jgi:hypothetical protein
MTYGDRLPSVVVVPEVWTRLPGTDWEVYHKQKRPVLLTDHEKGTHGLALRWNPRKKRNGARES